MTTHEDPRTVHRALARVAMCCDFPGPRGDRPPRWIADLATEDGIPSFHIPDRVCDHLRHTRQIAWSATGWRLTKVGWKALDAAHSTPLTA